MDKQSTYCGLLIYRTQRQTEFLLLNDTFSHKKHWTAPKGKVIGSEDEVKCALRETCEITGLSPKDLRVEGGFKAEIKYLSDTRPKKVIYFLAHLADNVRIIPTGEGINLQWWQLPLATEKAFYGSMQGVLKQAVLFIESNSHRLQLRGTPRLEKSFTAPAGLGGGHTNDGLESKFRNMNIALPLESQRQAMSRQRAEQHREQRNVRLERSFANELGKNGNKSSSQTLMPFENPLYKTRLCERFETEGHCPYDTKCTFAHSVTELRDRSKPTVELQNDNPLYKTRLCERFMKDNFCQYGPKCNFAHGLQELRERPKTKDGAENEELGNDYIEPNHRVRGERDDAGYAQHQSRTEKHEGRDRHDAAYGKPVTPLPAVKHEPTSEFLEMMLTLQEQPPVAPAPVVPVTTPHSKDINGSARTIAPAGARGRGGAPMLLKKLLSSNDEISNEKAWMKVVELSKDDQERLQTRKPQSPAPSLEKPLFDESIIRDLKKFVAQSPSDIVKEVTRVEMRNDLSKMQLFNAVIPTLLDEFGVDSTAHAVVGAIKSHEKLFKTLIRSRQDQLMFLGAWEKYVLHRNPGLLGKSPVMFKYLYDADLAEEDMFVKWYQAADDVSEVKKKTSVFIKWLENAEEED